MPKFRKKPVVIEAFQFTTEARWNYNSWPEWLVIAWGGPYREPGSFYVDDTKYYLGTLEGEHRVSDGDWIIRGVKNELYPCKPDIFEATYEAVL